MDRIVKQVKLRKAPDIKLKRVAAYSRVSTGKDAMLHSLSAQVSYYSEYIQRHPDWVYCGVYSDEGLTGTKVDRTGFQALIKECRAGNLDLVLTKSISRFARNTVTLLETVRELKELGVDVFFEEQNIHTLGPDGEVILTILASYAQEESRSVSENQKWRVHRAFENGELMNWRFMFGYTIDHDSVRINPEEAVLVQELFRRFIDGESLSSLARYLNSVGAEAKLGGKWTSSGVARLLGNEKYTGNALLQKTYRNNHIEKRQVKNCGELPMYYAEGSHDAIIDEGTFEKAQARLQEVRGANVGKKRPPPSVFSGKLRCCHCGEHYTRIKNHGRLAWNCNTYRRFGKTTCPGGQIREDILRDRLANAMGTSKFDELAFSEEVKLVTVHKDSLKILFSDGSEEMTPWQNYSRKGSWTPDMKEMARQKSLKDWSENRAKRNS